jgi:DNA helicase HerA-like ATPase
LFFKGLERGNRAGDSDGYDEENDNPTGAIKELGPIFEEACDGHPIVFDMTELSAALQRALVRSVLDSIEEICEQELSEKTERYPFIFFEEAHFYISEETILNVITRGRHIGIGSVFVTNTPQKLPDTVFRQLDNLFLLGLTHRDDIRNVSRNSFTDEATIESFATRMPQRHAMIVGNVTDRYPLVLSVDPLPANVPTTGRTRSTWDRFQKPAGPTRRGDD